MQRFLTGRLGLRSSRMSTPRLFSTAESELIVNKTKSLLSITLNRPKALNALTLGMCDQMKKLLAEDINAEGSSISAFIVKGAGGKAFCAGGDVRSIYNELLTLRQSGDAVGTGKPGQLSNDFFRQEYIMNYMLGTSKVPQVSIWDGIVMGGGVGISVLGEFRVATENTLFAMPETAIGLFPDVGSSAWLPHLEGGFGNYIGLTGCRLSGIDLLNTGIATHFVSRDKLAEVEAALTDLPLDPAESRKSIKSILDKYQSISVKPDSTQCITAIHADAIHKCFNEDHESMEDIIISLEKEAAQGDVWAAKSLELLKKMSPSSLKITFEQLRRGKDLDLQGCLKMEFRMMMKCMQNSDFQEGIRALLVDKSGDPKWNPLSIEQVTKDDVDSYFQPLGEYELTVA